jgi:hypothetical protein
MMSNTSENEQAHATEQVPDPTRTVVKRRTWPRGMPALRIGHAPPHVAPERDAEPVPSAAPGRTTWHLRLLRLVVGLVLLVLAWGGVLGVVVLGGAALHPAGSLRVVMNALLAIVELGGACWIGLATVTCIVAGAFSLSLALTNRDWR